MPKPKIKVHWRGSPASPMKHAVREVDGKHLAVTICGARVRDFWNGPGVRRKPSDQLCQKCKTLEPAGKGPGGPNYQGKTEVWL